MDIRILIYDYLMPHKVLVMCDVSTPISGANADALQTYLNLILTCRTILEDLQPLLAGRMMIGSNISNLHHVTTKCPALTRHVKLLILRLPVIIHTVDGFPPWEEIDTAACIGPIRALLPQFTASEVLFVSEFWKEYGTGVLTRGSARALLCLCRAIPSLSAAYIDCDDECWLHATNMFLTLPATYQPFMSSPFDVDGALDERRNRVRRARFKDWADDDDAPEVVFGEPSPSQTNVDRQCRKIDMQAEALILMTIVAGALLYPLITADQRQLASGAAETHEPQKIVKSSQQEPYSERASLFGAPASDR